ncbi:hypothetical protein KKI23_00680 [Patescibacteria group bacterium]|nr:hypothetical protein [Patescibacteria group bacterium]
MESQTARRIDDSVGYPAAVVQCGQYDYYFRTGRGGVVVCYQMTDANGSRDKTVPQPSIRVKRMAVAKLSEPVKNTDLIGEVPPRPKKKETEFPVQWASDRTVELLVNGRPKRLTQGKMKGRTDVPPAAISKAMAVITTQRCRKDRRRAAEAQQTELPLSTSAGESS